MNILKAEEARKMAVDNSELINQHLDNIHSLIRQEANQGYFTANYQHDCKEASLITGIQEILIKLGYGVTSFSLKSINLAIKW